ncbi:uncharacterized protein K460DRAFT_418116 [Cucurbitaria berberidis CBS 394.84]|uniref:Myb-like domain-containing protein n=1 Tax=Cucurbitaria berberidis CBS 394.84 TaxID=1168544 RepID=A0A9P4GCB0_9PLEO|nr:uncharacterized protein K460DRAFT_418116 [Cucurbitaria berberidis CBS 394.84]KAF1842970.1 hypothetical protein K460DRAFT_418116 [Cucurbitaria berberidis CBS 394.84]
MIDSTNPSSSSSDGESNDSSHRRFQHLNASLFPDNRDEDYASAYMNQGANNALNRQSPPSNPGPWSDPSESWRYDHDQVWTGEAWVYAPRPHQSSSTASNTQDPAGPQGNLTGPPNQPAVAAYSNAALPPANAPTPAQASSTSSTAPQTRQWTSAEILHLYKWKTIKKKGNALILKQFPGETEESLTAAWKQYKAEGERLMEQEREEGEEDEEK